MSGERIIEWWETIEVLPAPERSTLRAHLVSAHRMPAAVLDAHQPEEWEVWHRAEHKTRHPGGRPPHNVQHVGHLDHAHPEWLPAKAKEARAA